MIPGVIQEKREKPLNEDCEHLKIIALAKSFGAKETDYSEGVFVGEFESREALDHFASAMDEMDAVESYDIRIQGDRDEYKAFETLPADIRAVIIVYLGEDYIDYGYYEYDIDDEEEVDEPGDSAATLTAGLNEARRRIKVNSRGQKRVKMQCARGYKWNAENRSCQKIAGDQLARNRKSQRRAILTKKSMGSTFKARVLRKTRKAMRFRKSMGLKK